MTTLHRTALVPYQPKQMFALVNQIEHYPEFLPWCHGTTVTSRTESEVIATIEVAAKGIHKQFTTRNVLQPDSRMEMHLVEGPFREFLATWQFEPIGDAGCKVMLDMSFEFSNKIMSMLLGTVFNRAVNSMIEAFTKRAAEVYGS
ncbi:MAG: ubiquinone-binding protein [Legionellaceae bacterium]|nr:ubiquinone-binding protein [Legionellaceae bacterium]|tara:strand:+ start:440 stop:874 length:435 start_codon:yes stop_codon:yes gene_type:complete